MPGFNCKLTTFIIQVTCFNAFFALETINKIKINTNITLTFNNLNTFL